MIAKAMGVWVDKKYICRYTTIRKLELKLKKLKHDISKLYSIAEKRNRELEACKLIKLYNDNSAPSENFYVDECTVRSVEDIASKLRIWWNNNKSRNSTKISILEFDITEETK